MRLLVSALTLALLSVAPALAQDDAALPSASTQIVRASHTLAAIWRPITTTTQSALSAACAGASQDLAALDAAMPQDLNARSLSAVHVAHGLVFVPTNDDPSETFLFADSSMNWLPSGVAVIKMADEDSGRITLEDANGGRLQVQLGHAAGQLLMRLTAPDGQNLTFAGCTSTLNQPGNTSG